MFGWMKRTALMIAGLVALLFTAWVAGKRDQRKQDEVKDLRSYAKTRKEIDNAEDNISDDPAVLRDWLRERGKQ